MPASLVALPPKPTNNCRQPRRKASAISSPVPYEVVSHLYEGCAAVRREAIAGLAGLHQGTMDLDFQDLTSCDIYQCIKQPFSAIGNGHYLYLASGEFFAYSPGNGLAGFQ